MTDEVLMPRDPPTSVGKTIDDGDITYTTDYVHVNCFCHYVYTIQLYGYMDETIQL